MKRYWKLVVGLVLVLALGVTAAACGGDDEGGGGGSSSGSSQSDKPGEGKPAVTIGTKDFTEEFVLGELYKQALEAKGYNVNLKKNIGATEIIDKALTSGQIDGYPEYLGVALAVVAKENKPASSAAQTYEQAKAFYAKRGQTISERTPFYDVDAIATTKKYAQQKGLTTVADLTKLGPFTLGARPEFRNRQQGLKGMEEEYGIKDAKFRQVALGIQYQALDSGDVDTANVFSTDAQLASGKYTVLKDPKGVFGYQNVAFVIDDKKLKALGGQQFMNVIDNVNKLLTNDGMIAMNKAVAIDKQDEADVAKQFLQANKVV
jgi:osmoprotectant transport system substrate-binding protein